MANQVMRGSRRNHTRWRRAKATVRRPKDDADFATCLPRLDTAARTWLAGALDLVDPVHPWLHKISS